MVAAALIIGVARAISLVLTEGQVIDTIVQALVASLARVPPLMAMIIAVPGVLLVSVVWIVRIVLLR